MDEAPDSWRDVMIGIAVMFIPTILFFIALHYGVDWYLNE